MANVLYPKGKAHILGAATKIDLVADTVKVLMVHSATAAYSSTNEFVSDLAGGGIVARSGALTTKTVTAGVFDADDITVASVTGASIDALIVVKDTGTDSTSLLICWMDVTPLTPTGASVPIVWNASGIFAI